MYARFVKAMKKLQPNSFLMTSVRLFFFKSLSSCTVIREIRVPENNPSVSRFVSRVLCPNARSQSKCDCLTNDL